MLIAADILVNGQRVRTTGFEVGARPGSPALDWSITPQEASEEWDPPDQASDVPVDIKVLVNGETYELLESGRFQQKTEKLEPNGLASSMQGVDGSWRLFEKGPLRDTVFVPRTIIRELYPRGILIATLNGDSVLGIPPRRRKITGTGPRPNGDFGDTAETAFRGGAMASRMMMDEAEWTAIIDPPVCDPLEAFNDAYAKSNLPDFVIVGGDRGLKVKTYLEDEDQPDDACDDAKKTSKRIAGGMNALTINHLIRLIATKAGFTSVKINTPDLPLFEPVTVNAGSTWYAAIQALIGPWNAEVFVEGTTLIILDVEAANLGRYRSLVLSGEGVKLISRTVSRLPPFKGVNVVGPLRAGLAAMRDFRRGNPNKLAAFGDTDDDCRPPLGGGSGCAKNDLPSNYQVSAPPRAERVHSHKREDDGGGVHEVLISGESPYNLEVTRTYGSPSMGPFWTGEDRQDWTSVSIRKLYFADPALGQIQLRYLERIVTGGDGFATRTLSRQVTRIIQGRFGNTPCQVIQEEYAHARLPGLPFGGMQLIRRTITQYSENLSIEGTWDSTTDVYVLVVYTLGSNGGLFKPIPYDEAAHSGAIDLSGNSLDLWRLAHYSRTTESYQVLDKYFAQKESATVYSFGGEPPSGDVECFMYNQPEIGPNPGARQRYCFGVNIDGALIESVLAIGAATEEQAELVADRSKRRGGQRTVRMEIEVPTFIPNVRRGTGCTIAGTPIAVLNQDNTEMQTVNRLAGDYFINGYSYTAFPVGNGAFRIHTRLSLRSQF